jgi:hypothetical protein
MKPLKSCRVGLFILILFFTIDFALLAVSENGKLFVISKDKPVTICIPDGADNLTSLAAENLSAFINKVTGLTLEKLRVSQKQDIPKDNAVIVMETSQIPYFRPDGYKIRSGQWEGRPAVRITAPKPEGLNFAAYRLIREMIQNSNKIEVPDLSLGANPWCKIREANLGIAQYHINDAEKPDWDKWRTENDWPFWEEARVERLIDLMGAMGFNSFQESVVSKNMPIMLKRAKRNGMKTTVWLNAQYDRPNPKEPRQLEEIRKIWEGTIKEYGPLADRWELHWADPGGSQAEGCDIKTPQELSNQFYTMLREMGFKSDVSFSLWKLNSGAWKGYDNWNAVLNSGILFPEIGITMMRTYDPVIAQAIVAQDRKAGVWGWYLADQETNPSMHVHAKILEREFHRIHSSASALLDWYAIDSNSQLQNLPTLYVAAQLLWDNNSSADELLYDFSKLVFGPKAAPAITDALKLIGEIRCGPGTPIIKENFWPNDYMCRLGSGTDSPEKDLADCEKTLQKLNSVTIDSAYVSKLPLIFAPAEFLKQLRLHLGHVRDYARLRVAYRDALKPVIEDGNFKETQKQMASLPKLPDRVEGIVGLLENNSYALGCPYNNLKKYANDWAGRSLADNLALKKKVSASRWLNHDPRFSPEMAVNGVLCEYEEEGWAGGNIGPDWLKIDLGAVQTVSRVRIYNRGYKREANIGDKDLAATPSKVKVFYATDDSDLSKGTVKDDELGYQLIGGFNRWDANHDSSSYKEIVAKSPVQARYIKVLISESASNLANGCGEVEVFR